MSISKIHCHLLVTRSIFMDTLNGSNTARVLALPSLRWPFHFGADLYAIIALQVKGGTEYYILDAQPLPFSLDTSTGKRCVMQGAAEYSYSLTPIISAQLRKQNILMHVIYMNDSPGHEPQRNRFFLRTSA